MKKIISTFVALMVCAMMTSIVSAQNPAKEILIKISQSKDCPFSKEVFDGIDWDNPNRHNTDEHFQFDDKGSATGITSYVLDCFKRKDGNYTALLVKLSVAVNTETEISGIKTEMTNWLYKGGKVHLRPNEEVIKMPTIANFYSNTADFPKPLYDSLKNIIAQNRFLGVGAKPNERNLVISFIPDLKKLEGIMAGFEKIKSLPQIYYSWNGEKMVRRPESKPIDLDLSLFGVEGYETKIPANYAVEAIKTYYATDPYGIGLSQKEYLEQYGNRINTLSPTTASGDVNFPDENGWTVYNHLQFSCYEYKKGGYLAVLYKDAEKTLAMYSFKDGELTLLSNAFPQFDKAAIETQTPTELKFEIGYSTYPFTADGFTLVKKNIEYDQKTFEMIDHGDTLTEYKWDGEKFVKQQ